jgi:ribulose-5-phosphate 4-epimerase/fuculose-1-phosphate aldolase
LAQTLGTSTAVIMRGHGITTAAHDIRAATVAACFAEESARLQLAMLGASGGDSTRIRAYSTEEANRVSDQLGPSIVARAWEYYAAVADARPIGG